MGRDFFICKPQEPRSIIVENISLLLIRQKLCRLNSVNGFVYEAQAGIKTVILAISLPFQVAFKRGRDRTIGRIGLSTVRMSERAVALEVT